MWMLGRRCMLTMVKVPVLHPKDLTYVGAPVLAESLKTMCGFSKVEPVADSAASMRPLQEHVKKRRLYRTATDESVWFPHDNHPDLLKELVWESGSPRWVLHGTPASGAGGIGCFDTGVSVIALCENAHHHKHLDIALRERAVEAMRAGSRTFKDETLQARALELCLQMNKEKKVVEGDSDSDCKPKKGKKKDGAKKRKRGDTDSSSEDSSSDSSPASSASRVVVVSAACSLWPKDGPIAIWPERRLRYSLAWLGLT